MRCYLCGYLTDHDDGGLCPACRELVHRNNERVMAGGYLKIATIERIEAALQKQPLFVE